MLKSVIASCSTGYYEISSAWYLWDSTCKTWSNATACMTWESTMFLNTTTNLWQNCPDSQYYDSTSEVWRDWNGKCTVSWSYQRMWFLWTGSQYYDLETLQCVDACDSSKVSVNKTQFQSIPIWKSTNIYVDPTSTSVTELGTKDNPYKNLLLAFIEILNLHSHTNRTINVYVQTGTTLYVIPDYMYLINVNKVNLLTYTGSSTSNLRPSIISKPSGVTLLSPKTMFNIISSIQLNLASNIINPNLTAKEQSDLQTTYVGFMVDRWDFTIDGLDFMTNHGQSSKTFTWIKAIYEQSKTITLNNMNIVVGGYLLDSFDPLNLNLSNLNIDYYKNARGLYILTQWNYANASLANNIVVTNITVYNSVTRLVTQTNSLLYISGNTNFTMSNSSISLFGSDTENFPQVYFSTSSNCNPNDGLAQFLTIQNTAFTLSQTSNNTRFVQLYSNIDASYYRKVTITLNGLSFNGLVMNSQPIFNLYANTMTNVVIGSLVVSNSTFADDIVDISNTANVLLSNSLFKNISKFGEAAVSVSGGLNVDINGLTIDSWTLSTTDNYYYYTHSSSNGYTNITGIAIINTDLKNRAAVYLSSVSWLVISNSSISKSIIYSSNSIIKTGSLAKLIIDGFYFTQITSDVSGDSSNYIFSFDSFDLSNGSNFLINKVTVTQSELAVLSFNKVVNPSSIASIFTISNFVYSNSSFADTNNLIEFSKLEQSISFSIVMSNITFNLVSFNVSGNLISFQQQLSNYVSISSLTITNTTNANIVLQAINKQNTQLPVGVIVSSLTTSNVNSGSSSLFVINDNAVLNVTNSTIQTITR